MKLLAWGVLGLILAGGAAFLVFFGNVTHVRFPVDVIGLAASYANRDIENQKPLANPPSVIKAVYATSWSAADEGKLNYLINLINTTELNAIVIDLKAYDGYIAYEIENKKMEDYGAKKAIIKKLNTLIKRLHDRGIYAIARITVFQDPILAKARPDLAVQNKSGGVWRDNKGLAWIDPASREAWDYILALGRDAAERGFDELNFDYIRFPSDGDLGAMTFPFYDGTVPESEAIADFFSYLRQGLSGVRLSADLFGLATIDQGDLGIGQVIENAYAHFDVTAPMVYPSHYAKGFIGYRNPALHPYEVVKYSMDGARKRLAAHNKLYPASTTPKLRPWIQDFDLGADYDAEMVRKEIQAAEDSLLSGLGEAFGGWMLWNPSNVYTKEALRAEDGK